MSAISGDLRIELGLTEQRGDELIEIVHTTMDQSAQGDPYGRTSHVLLSIAGRKDLNDVEKVACTFLFALEIIRNEHKMSGMPNVTNIGLDPRVGMDCIVVASEKVNVSEMMAVMMATLMSLLRQIPNSDAREFCKKASLAFVRIAMTGDVRL